MATKEDIWAAATMLAEAGERPTLSAVRKVVGGGSYTTISEAMAEWRARQTQTAPSREPFIKPWNFIPGRRSNDESGDLRAGIAPAGA